MAAVLFVLPLIGSVTVGDALAVLGTIASFLLRPHPQQPTFKAMSSAWGQAWPKVYNYGRVAGKVIQASDVTKHGGKKGKKVAKFSQTFAVGFCEGPADILRIWADQQVIYDARPLTSTATWAANTQYASGDIVAPTVPDNRQFIATTDGQSGATEPTWATTLNATTRDNEVVWNTQAIPKARVLGKQYNFTMRIYRGDETQLEDSALEELVGVGNQSAYRGLCYIVLEGFDLSKYGNRIPNLEAEIGNFSAPVEFYVNNYNSFAFGAVTPHPEGRYAYAIRDEHGECPDRLKRLVKIDLNSANVVAVGPWFNSQIFIISPEITGCIPWTTRDKIWFDGAHETVLPLNCAAHPSTSVKAMLSFDLTTLDIVDVFEFTGLGGGTPDCVTTDGLTSIGLGYIGSYPAGDQNLFAMNLTSGAFSNTLVSTIGGPATQGTDLLYYAPTFDNSGYVWILGNHGKLWRVTMTQSGASAPVCSAMISFDLQPYAINGGILNVGNTTDFNPDTGVLTVWAPCTNNGYLVQVMRWDTIGHTVLSVYEIDIGNSFFGQSTDQELWNNKRYVALAPGNLAKPPGIYDRLTGVATYFEFSKWNISGLPKHQSIFMALTNQDGTAITTTTFSATTTFYDFVFWPFGSSLTLEDINADIADRVGLSGKYDFSGLASVIPRGITLEDRMPARQFVEQIMPAYFYDLTDIGEAIVGTLRSNASLLLTIPEDDLAAADSPETFVDRLAIERNDDIEIPRDLSVSYKDYQHDYQGGSTPSSRLPITQHSSGRNTILVPCVFTPSEAINIAERILYLSWIERDTFRLSAPLEYLEITPADVIDVVRDSTTHRIRVTKVTLKPDQIIEIEGCSEDFGTYSLTAPPAIADQTSGSFVDGDVDPIITPALNVLDTATLRQEDLQNPGVYVAGSTSVLDGNWDSEPVQESTDNSTWDTKATLTVESVMGECNTTLADCVHHCLWDRVNTLRVSVYFGQLASASESDLITNFTNLIWLSNGELIQFATATLVSAGVWDLTNLLRGRLGTEQFTGTHAAAETFVFIDPTTMQTVDYFPSELDATRYWRGQNDAETDPTTAVQTLTMTTRRLMPFAPCYIKGSRDGGNNLTITGLRRMRFRGAPLWTPPETDLPVTMEADIMNGVTVVRTITATASGGGSVVSDASAFSIYYSAADQTTDFGSPQASLTVKVYQLNSVRGRGYAGTATI